MQKEFSAEINVLMGRDEKITSESCKWDGAGGNPLQLGFVLPKLV